MIQLDFNPSSHKLRQFSWTGAVLLVLAGLLHALPSGSMDAAWIYGGIAALLLIGGFAAPCILRWPYILLSILVYPIGFLVSHIILVLIFYGLFTPLALWFRIIGRDALRQKLDPDADSYWLERKTQRPAEDYYRQF